MDDLLHMIGALEMTLRTTFSIGLGACDLRVTWNNTHLVTMLQTQAVPSQISLSVPSLIVPQKCHFHNKVRLRVVQEVVPLLLISSGHFFRGGLFTVSLDGPCESGTKIEYDSSTYK